MDDRHASVDQVGRPRPNPLRTDSPVGGSMMGVGAAAPGIMAIGFTLFFATIGVLLATAIYPVGGSLTIGVYFFLHNVIFLNFMKNTSEVVAIFMFLIPGCLVFYGAMRVESWLSQFRPYGWFRLVWRMLAIMIVAWMITAMITGSNKVPETAPLSEQVPWTERFVMICGLVVGFLFSRFLDRNIRTSGAPARLALPWRKKKERPPPLPWHTPNA